MEQAGFFEALLDAAVDAIIIIDDRGTIKRFNRSAQRIFGYNEAEVLRQNVSILMPEPNRANHHGYMNRYLETGRAAIIGKGRTELGQRKSGEVFPMRLSVGKSSQGGEVHFVGIVHDLSLEQATEQKVRILEQQLLHADRLLTLSELTAGIAHEINQPLTAIAAYADAARHLVENAPAPVDPAFHTICSRISDQSRRAAAVVERLRALVRRGTNAKASHDMRKIITNTLLLFDYEVQKSGISIVTHAPGELPDVFIDEIQIQQILVNLVKNSLDALVDSGQAAGKVEISVSSSPDKLSVTVRDNGPGIKPESLHHLFEPFYTSKPKGLGLGLNICRNIAAAHGGKLTHTSPVEGGAQFTLQLPLSSIG